VLCGGLSNGPGFQPEEKLVDGEISFGSDLEEEADERDYNSKLVLEVGERGHYRHVVARIDQRIIRVCICGTVDSRKIFKLVTGIS